MFFILILIMANKLSIITINYNNKDGLKRTFESIFSQSNKAFDYIVIDGGSKDGSKDLIEQNKNKITYWVSEQDNGIYDAMNKGILATKTEYLMFINSGDELYEINTIERLTVIAPYNDVTYSDTLIVSDEGSYIAHYPKEIKFSFLYSDSLSHPGCVIKTKLFEQVGFYDTSLKICSDWKWFLLAFFKFNIEPLYSGIIAAKFYLDGVSSSDENYKLILLERNITINKEFPYLEEDYAELANYKRIVGDLKRSRLIKGIRSMGFLNFLKNL